jgi:hypothetical protein
MKTRSLTTITCAPTRPHSDSRTRRAHIPVATLDSRSCGPTESAGIVVVGTRQRRWSDSESDPRCTRACVIMAPRRASPLAEGRADLLLSRVQMMCCLVGYGHTTTPIPSKPLRVWIPAQVRYTFHAPIERARPLAAVRVVEHHGNTIPY